MIAFFQFTYTLDDIYEYTYVKKFPHLWMKPTWSE